MSIEHATKDELAQVRQAIRELVRLESRFKAPSFDRYREQGQPLEALEAILQEGE